MPLDQPLTENPRVLVVEDDPVSAKLIQRLFSSQGLEVDHASDGAIALGKHQADAYRIVVSDWMMPEMDGVDLCREFRKISGPYVYFILCTAKNEKEDRIQAYEAGVDDFLTKPLDRHELQARLKVARRILSTEDALQRQNEKLEETAKQLTEQMVQLNEFSAQLGSQKLMLEQMNKRLNHLAITDGLTGLWNHRRFQELLEESVEVFNRTGEAFSLVLLDIDYFKRVNDEHGHQVGDEVLQLFAQTLKDKARNHELPARYGGEEFAIILRRCDHLQATMAAERFRVAIEGRHWKYSPMTASFGVTTCIEIGDNPVRLIEQADRAMYAAKLAGRNKVVHFQDLPDDVLMSASH